MSKYIGRLVKLGIAKESSRGALPSSYTYHLPQTSFAFDDKVVKARSLGGLGYLEDSEEAFVVNQYGQGEIEAEIRSKSFGLILLAMLGSVSTSGPTDSAYTHSFSLNNSNQHQSLGFLVYDPNQQESYQLVMLEQLAMMFELDQIAKFNASFMSKRGKDSTASFPSLGSESKFTKKHFSFKVANNLAGLDAASAISVKSLTLNIAKNVMLDDVLGTAEPEDILNRQISVEGELTLNTEDQTWKNYMRNGDSKAVEIKLTNTDATIGSATRPSLTIRLPKVDFFDWEPDYSLDDIVKQKITFKGSRDVANGNSIISTCDLVNDAASY